MIKIVVERSPRPTKLEKLIAEAQKDTEGLKKKARLAERVKTRMIRDLKGLVDTLEGKEHA